MTKEEEMFCDLDCQPEVSRTQNPDINGHGEGWEIAQGQRLPFPAPHK